MHVKIQAYVLLQGLNLVATLFASSHKICIMLLLFSQFTHVLIYQPYNNIKNSVLLAMVLHCKSSLHLCKSQCQMALERRKFSSKVVFFVLFFQKLFLKSNVDTMLMNFDLIKTLKPYLRVICYTDSRYLLGKYLFLFHNTG